MPPFFTRGSAIAESARGVIWPWTRAGAGVRRTLVKTPPKSRILGTGHYLPPIVRTKDLLKVKGMLINPAALMEAVRTVEGVDEFQIVVGKQDSNDAFSMDEMIVRVASTRTDRDALAAAVVTAAQGAVQVRPRVEFAAAREIYDPAAQTKAVRLIDRR